MMRPLYFGSATSRRSRRVCKSSQGNSKQAQDDNIPAGEVEIYALLMQSRLLSIESPEMQFLVLRTGSTCS